MNENMENTCRTCLSTENELLLITSEIENNYRVIDYFNECLNIQISDSDKDDNLPKKICLMCLDNLLKIRRFYKKCIESEKYLKDQINKKATEIKEENTDSDSNEKIPKINPNTNNDYDGDGVGQRPQKKMLYKCPDNDCVKSFNSTNLLYKHVTNNHLSENNSLLCQYCGQISKTKDELKNHVSKYHQNHDLKRKFKCNICESSFYHKNNLISHERRHTDERPFKCEYCEKTFRQRSALDIHITLHTGKLIKCHLCDKRFSRKGFLTVHMRSHTNERPYACAHCPQRYTQKCHLKSHLTNHSFERPHQCKICGMTFARKDIFRNHLFTHTPKPYKCPECSLETAFVSWFRKHLKRAHNMEDVDVNKYKRKIILNSDTADKAIVYVIAEG